ncbi:MAG: DUF1566 domain-containing protein [Prevotella sp.]|nr:DUF1566 domain-containing protein [Prevotella sp.]
MKNLLYCLLLIFIPIATMAQGTITRPSKSSTVMSKKDNDTKRSKPKHEVVTISSPDGFINGYGYVDLGLPSGLKWAYCNIDAETPSDFGNYYAWGEVIVKSFCDESNSKTYEQYIDDISGNQMYDVASKTWLSTWRIPTKNEFEELINNCVWKWGIYNNIQGYKVLGLNGHSIFIPATGYGIGRSKGKGRDEAAYYWSSTPSMGNLKYAYRLHFQKYNDLHIVEGYYRCWGFSIRPVSD